MVQLTHSNSPLAQVTSSRRMNMADSSHPLSMREQQTVKRVLDEKYEYVDNEIFDMPAEEAEKQIFENSPEIDNPDTSWYHPMMENIAEINTSSNVTTKLLTAKQERTIFAQFNYCRMRVCVLRDKLKQQYEIDTQMARDLLYWYERADNYRDKIAQANIALVLAMAKRAKLNSMDFADLVSEGNMALLRSVDKFDATRGFKFSTYACRAILKAFSRGGAKFTKYRNTFPVEFDPKMEKSNYSEQKHNQKEDDCADEVRLIMKDNRAKLSEVEQEVISHRFAIGEDKKSQDASPMTLKQVGAVIGVTKERVRQIQKKAMVKIREALDEQYLR